MTRYNPDGSRDEQFGEKGQCFIDLKSLSDAGIPGVALDRDGNILVGASPDHEATGRDFTILRILGKETWVPKWE